ncbi:uncharacterized protein PHALS_09597 [Plasmopara halstedii]|uniref:Uncharacterized protein n=1 Tax=Plasmopara halstedii TaxID=4781 RepID=A0A0P1AF55_PLAHL|nr:uncharacterized protein PHALS_09597 [Plasmopara halstedii]CEG39343.1 hypothetical protein PHALS_09597 [Plasmopara halstedii]|eukprot:XP_024575712.1 hypothetical protein PHALS_09597 [Plasmopara halstedii]
MDMGSVTDAAIAYGEAFCVIAKAEAHPAVNLGRNYNASERWHVCLGYVADTKLRRVLNTCDDIPVVGVVRESVCDDCVRGKMANCLIVIDQEDSEFDQSVRDCAHDNRGSEEARAH